MITKYEKYFLNVFAEKFIHINSTVFRVVFYEEGLGRNIKFYYKCFNKYKRTSWDNSYCILWKKDNQSVEDWVLEKLSIEIDKMLAKYNPPEDKELEEILKYCEE